MPEYFTVQPEATTPTPPLPPSQGLDPRLKKAAMIVGALIMLIFVGVLVRNLFFKGEGSERTQRLEDARALIENAVGSCEEDKACTTAVQTSAARDVGEAAVCDGLPDDEYENCVTLIAFDQKNKEVCRALEGEPQDSCEEAVTVRLASDGAIALPACDDIKNESRKADCQNLVTTSAVAKGTCAELGVDEARCSAAASMATIIGAGDYLGCDTLPDDARADCRDAFRSIDQDGDGLTLFEEDEIGTSDTLADTDGDGFTDDVEVENGYNPLQ